MQSDYETVVLMCVYGPQDQVCVIGLKVTNIFACSFMNPMQVARGAIRTQ